MAHVGYLGDFRHASDKVSNTQYVIDGHTVSKYHVSSSLFPTTGQFNPLHQVKSVGSGTWTGCQVCLLYPIWISLGMSLPVDPGTGKAIPVRTKMDIVLVTAMFLTFILTSYSWVFDA
jgi:hypothetical protein